jgi:hypothetical protein
MFFSQITCNIVFTSHYVVICMSFKDFLVFRGATICSSLRSNHIGFGGKKTNSIIHVEVAFVRFVSDEDVILFCLYLLDLSLVSCLIENLFELFLSFLYLIIMLVSFKVKRRCYRLFSVW